MAEMGRQWDKGVEVLRGQLTGWVIEKQVMTLGVLGGNEKTKSLTLDKASRSQGRELQGKDVGIEETQACQL